MRQKRQYNINIIQQKYYTIETKRRFVTIELKPIGWPAHSNSQRNQLGQLANSRGLRWP